MLSSVFFANISTDYQIFLSLNRLCSAGSGVIGLTPKVITVQPGEVNCPTFMMLQELY
jgi:hypothetical protein